MEFIDVARRVNDGQGYLLGIKAYHVGGSTVLHQGLDERAPLYVLVISSLLRLGGNVPSLQLVNVLLAAAALAITVRTAQRLFGSTMAWLTAATLVASPVVFQRTVPPMSEALALALSCLALNLASRSAKDPSRKALAVAGMCLGLAYLTRPAALALAPAVMLADLVQPRANRERWPRVAWLATGLAVVLIPTTLYSLAARGTLSYSGQTYLYSVHKDADVLRNGFGSPIPPPLEFIRSNADFVVAAILDNGVDYARLLFLDADWLWPLIWTVPIAVTGLLKPPADRRVAYLLIPAAANFAAYAATWANFQERYQLPTLVWLVPLLLCGTVRLIPFRVAAIPLVPTLAMVGAVFWWSPALIREYRGQHQYGDEPVGRRTDRGLTWTGPPRWVQDSDLDRLLEWVRSRTQPGDSLAAAQPWPVTYFTSRPTALLPARLEPPVLERFITTYHLAYVVVDTRDRDRRDYVAPLQALASRGVTMLSVGNYRVFTTTALWERPV
ncbi:MAG: glycosyltransferase family 39 protein [Chloroflexota bacterium]